MPSSPYRNDSRADILRERCVAVANELADVTARRANERTLRAHEEELRGELARMRIELARSERRLPLLSSVKIASPCSANWDAMVGDDKTRFCGSCQKNVHNLSAMSAAEAEALMGSTRGSGTLCVRYFQRADGTIMTSDCSVGAKTKRVRRLAVIALGAGAATVIEILATSTISQTSANANATMSDTGMRSHLGAMVCTGSECARPAPDGGI